MQDTANRTFICSVVFIDLVGYSKKTVTEQIRLKTSLTNNLSEAIKDIPVNDRIILDTGDGAAISFLGDPEDALFVTLSLREAIAKDNAEAQEGAAEATVEDAVRMGINLGPVKLVKDINGHPNIIGDGINVAQRIMSFARPGQIVVSRSYYDVVSNLAGEYAKLFTYEGSRTDKHVREHEIYVVGHHEGALQKARDGIRDRASSTSPNAAARRTGTHGRGGDEGSSTLTIPIPSFDFVRDKKKLTMLAGGLAFLVLVLAILVATKKPSAPDGLVAAAPASATPTTASSPSAANPPPATAAPPKSLTVPIASAPEPAKPAPPEPAKPDAKVLDPKPSPSQVPPAAPAPAVKADAKPETSRPETAKAEAKPADATKVAAASPPPATLIFAVAPWGEIFVDGKSRGVTPPMKSLKLPPGKYKLEVKNTTFPVHVETLDLKTRDEITVRHRFQ